MQQKLTTSQNVPTYAGIHLSGANTAKTALCILAGTPGASPLKVRKVYDKIGSFGTLFSDDRLCAILSAEGPFREMFVDCPLSLPPCVKCQRSSCPGVLGCEDEEVAYMMARHAQKKRNGGRKPRPINPQSHRLWDVYIEQMRSDNGLERYEQSFSANMAPLALRARTLQKRLVSVLPGTELRETYIVATLAALAPVLGLDERTMQHYKNFEKGMEVRTSVCQNLVTAGWIKPDPVFNEISVEVFQALITSLVAAFYDLRLTGQAPDPFFHEEGWVHVPELTETHKLPGRFFE